ncbi:MAG: polysaccharide deacetylase family protein [Blastomonas sp.]
MAFQHKPTSNDMIRMPGNFGQRFLVTVDVEEEFDWNAPFRADGYGLETVRAILAFQELCEEYGVKPLYLVDFPVIESADGAEIYGGLVREGKADVGIQLHPWVNPPHDEEVTTYNSFAGNLPEQLEAEKLQRLASSIERACGSKPLAYRAGRYGLGANSIGLLGRQGVRLDTSVRSNFDYSGEGGPNFAHLPLHPYWLDRASGLAELPVTTVFWGMLRKQGKMLFPHAARSPMLRAILARTGMLERIALTPEGISVREVIRGIDIALDDGLPILNFSFHSPSLEPGHTPYVRTPEDAEAFLDWWRRVFDYLLLRRIPPVSLGEIIAAIDAGEAG